MVRIRNTSHRNSVEISECPEGASILFYFIQLNRDSYFLKAKIYHQPFHGKAFEMSHGVFDQFVCMSLMVE